MDPLSITVSVLSLVSRSITTIQTCQRYASKYQDAELSMISLRTECSAINLALSQIQRLITRDQRRNLKDRFEEYVLVEYESVLTGCQLVFTTFIARASELGLDKEDNLKEAKFWEKVKYVWNEPQMESLRAGISGQANAVGILLSVFQAESSDKAYSLMRNDRARTSFKRVANDTASLIRSLSVSNASSRDVGTYEGTVDSLLGDEDFSFDNIVLDSAAYRRAFVRQQSRNQLKENNDDSTAIPNANKRALSIISDDTGNNVSAARPKADPGVGIATKPLEVAAGSIILPLSRTELTSQESIPSTSTKALQTSPIQSSGIDEPVNSSEIAKAGPKYNDTHWTHSQTKIGQSEQLPFFRDYYSQDDIYPGDKVSTLWAYQPRAGDEFSLERGDMLKVIGIWDDGWATGVMIRERAHEWDAQTEGKASGSSAAGGEIKAFPLVCVCMPKHWRSTIEGNKSSEIDSNAAQQGGELGTSLESKSRPTTVTKATLEVRAPKLSSGQDEKLNAHKSSFTRRLLKVLRARQMPPEDPLPTPESLT